MSQLVQQLTDNFVVLAAALIALGLGRFSINYLSKRRQMLHQERMATLVKGLHYAAVAKDIFSKPTADWLGHALRDLHWILGGAGFSFALYGCLMLALVFLTPAIARASAWDLMTKFTVNHPFEVPGMTLQPNTRYTIRLYDSPSTRNVVQVLNADGTSPQCSP
jgi:hypothetical protein